MADEVALAEQLPPASYVRDRNTGVNHEIVDIAGRAMAEAAQGTADIAVGKADSAQQGVDANTAALATKYESGPGVVIPDGANLNNYGTVGKYFYGNGSISTIENLPKDIEKVGALGFALIVEDDSTGSVARQTLIGYMTNGGMKYQRFGSIDETGSFQPWGFGWFCVEGIDAVVSQHTATGNDEWSWKKYASGYAEASIFRGNLFPSDYVGMGSSGLYHGTVSHPSPPFQFKQILEKSFNESFWGGALTWSFCDKVQVDLISVGTDGYVRGTYLLRGTWK